jgi:Ca2+/Na+ antiporter
LIERHGEPAQLIFVWFSNNSRIAVVILVGSVFFFILIIAGSRGGTAAPARLRQEKMSSDVRRVMLAFQMVTTFTIRV